MEQPGDAGGEMVQKLLLESLLGSTIAPDLQVLVPVPVT
jgi:hypothetical protein